MISESPLTSFHSRNLLTYFVVISSMAAILYLLRNHRVQGEVGMLMSLAILLDCFDGKFSRLFKSSTIVQQQLGAELDSLADFFAFGVVPSFALAYFAGFQQNDLSERSIVLFTVGTWYLFCVLHRLAFFNVSTQNGEAFTGLPSPLGALVVSFAWILNNSLQLEATSWLMILSYLGSGLWMVSSHKIPRPRVRGMLVLTALIAVSFVLHAL